MSPRALPTPALRLFLFLLLMPAALLTAEDATPFPFAIPWNDVAPTVISCADLGPAPLTPRTRLSVAAGHFANADGRRVRLVGASMVAGGNFPRPEDAPTIAAHLRKYGFNCVRLHHMDAPWASPNIFSLAGQTYGKPTTELDPRSLDRLDHLVAELARQGVYVDVNLHVARGYNATDGFPDAERLDGSGKVVGYFEPGMIERQRLYARQLLGHRNPYTGSTYAEDPAVALVEIDNEDSLLGAVDSLPGLPPHYLALLTTGWNDFLQKKYATTATLLAAWNAAAKPLGANLIANGRFADPSAGLTGWILETHQGTAGALATAEVSGQTNAPAGRALRAAELKTDGTGWHLQLHQVGLDLEDGETYTLTFAARAAEPRTLGIGCLLDRAPWSGIGLGAGDALGTNWRRYSHTFVAKGTQPKHSRLTFMLGDAAAEVELGDVQLRPGGGGVDLSAGKSLEAGTLELPSMTDSVVGRDLAEYLMAVEAAYADGMRAFLREQLHVTAPILCSQASYGGLGGVARESRMDVVDMHAYWQHPSFPHRPFDWDDFRTANTAMVADRGWGTLDGLAMHRVAGKPFIVSEYDHPAPNEWSAECAPMIFSYASAQDWDGVFLFNWEGGDQDHVFGFFDQTHHPAKLGLMPTAARLFRRGDVWPALGSQTLTVARSAVPAIVARRSDYSFWSGAADAGAPSDTFERITAVAFGDGDQPTRVVREDRDGHRPGQPMLMWEHADPKQALYAIDGDAVKGVIGFLGGRSRDLSGLAIDMPASARNFAAITLVALDGKATRDARSLLLSAIDKAENPGLVWDAERHSAAKAWSQGPVQVWGIAATIAIRTTAASAEVFALDSTGARATPVPSTLAGGTLRFAISPSCKTMWYEIAAK